jgi:hypothetical protein
MACPELYNKPPFSIFTMPLYLSFMECDQMRNGISRVWVLGPKLQFHKDVHAIDTILSFAVA